MNMKQQKSSSQHNIHSAYMHFERQKWANLRDHVELTLSEDDLKQLQGINESLSIQEVKNLIEKEYVYIDKD